MEKFGNWRVCGANNNGNRTECAVRWLAKKKGHDMGERRRDFKLKKAVPNINKQPAQFTASLFTVPRIYPIGSINKVHIAAKCISQDGISFWSYRLSDLPETAGPT